MHYLGWQITSTGNSIQGMHMKISETLGIYGVPFPPKFNVIFYIVLCTIYPTFCVCHLQLHSRFNFFAFNIQLWLMQHSSFRSQHSTFHKQQSSFLFDFGHCTCKFPHSTLNFSNWTFTGWSASDGDRGLNWPDSPLLKWWLRVDRETSLWSG